MMMRRWLSSGRSTRTFWNGRTSGRGPSVDRILPAGGFLSHRDTFGPSAFSMAMSAARAVRLCLIALNLFNSACQTTRLTTSVLGTFSGGNSWTRRRHNMMNMATANGRHWIALCIRRVLVNCRIWHAIGHGQTKGKGRAFDFKCSRSIYKCLRGRSKDILS